MNKSKNFLTVSALITVFGIALITVGYLLGSRITGISLSNSGISVYSLDNLHNSTDIYTEENISLDSFLNIRLDSLYADIRIEQSDHYGLSYHTYVQGRPSYQISDDTLIISQNYYPEAPRNFQWMLFGIDTSIFHSIMKSESITIYVPSGLSLKDITLTSSSGNTILSGLTADSITLQNVYGSIAMENLTASSIDLYSESGTISLLAADTDLLNISNVYGDVYLKTVLPASEYNLDLSTAYGSIHVDDAQAETKYSSTPSSGGNKTIRVNCDSGDINIRSSR